MADERVERARLLYERAVFAGDLDAPLIADRELNAVEADLALTRGQVMHARFLQDREEFQNELPSFERALNLYRSLGDERGQAEALFWIGCFHQVVRDDNDTAVPLLSESRDLAAKVGDKLTISYALRHLGIAEHISGRLEQAREFLEESTRLRRELGFLPGVAANLVGLIHIAKAQGRTEDASALADEGAAIAKTSGATKILQQINEAGAGL